MANIQHEAKSHPTSPFFLNLSKEIERTYEDLRARKMRTEEAVEKLLKISEKIIRWKREEKEIGKSKYPIYEALNSILPEIEKKKALSFIDKLLTRLKEKGLLFKEWQHQREVRRRVNQEIRLLLLAEFKNYKDKIDKLNQGVFEALEGIGWSL